MYLTSMRGDPYGRVNGIMAAPRFIGVHQAVPIKWKEIVYAPYETPRDGACDVHPHKVAAQHATPTTPSHPIRDR